MNFNTDVFKITINYDYFKAIIKKILEQKLNN